MLSKKLIFTILVLFHFQCAETIDVEYPVFPKDKEGRALQKFLGQIRNVGIAVEKPKKSLFESIFGSGSSFIDQMPAKVFEAFDKESYFRLTDLSKRADILNEATFSLTGVTESRANIGKLIGAEAILYIGYQKPYTECGTENKIDLVAAGRKAAGIAASMIAKQGTGTSTSNEPVSKPTGVRYMLIPLDATLINVETGEVKKAVVSNPAKVFNSVGNLRCPSVLDSFGQGLEEAAQYVKSRLSPKVKTEKIKVFVESEDLEVKEFLTEGYEEIKGETPSFKKAKVAWEKADQKSGGKSWAAKANLATYFFSSGDYEAAIKLYEAAMNLSGSDKSYLRELRKRVEAVSAVDDSAN
ncbi:lipoprotein LipL41 [Leptospira ellisii]|uniref:Lipoprotein LipL41 n=1 Tax=Leptospira ellisii TaxID=2023197 RepID=A0AAE4TZT5_9LEPT|nr:lipoprotein LipL41 [Leptospira ellisii]MDV6237169.1 lipoprotein LipL41 [Leptospira ellisii]